MRIATGILGFGRMGRLHARVLAQLSDRFDLRGYADPAQPEAPFADGESLVRSVDLVIIATPTPSHARLTHAALEQGKAVLVEKPLASTRSEARKLSASVGAERLFVGHSERFHPVVRALRTELAQPRAGQVQSVELERVIPEAGAEDDVLLNLGVHDLDLAEHLTGDRMRVVIADGNATSSYVALEAGSTRATVRCARAGIPGRRVRVVTSAFTFEGDLLSPRLTVRATHVQGNGTPRVVALPREEPLVAQAIALHRATISWDAVHVLATAREGARAVELATAAVALRDRERELETVAASA